MRWVVLDDLADDHPVKQMPECREMLFHRGPGFLLRAVYSTLDTSTGRTFVRSQTPQVSHQAENSFAAAKYAARVFRLGCST